MLIIVNKMPTQHTNNSKGKNEGEVETWRKAGSISLLVYLETSCTIKVYLETFLPLVL